MYKEGGDFKAVVLFPLKRVTCSSNSYPCVFPPFPQQLLFFNMPLTCYLCWSLHLRSRGNSFRSHFLRPGYRWKTLGVHTAMLLLLAWQGYSCYFLLETYGPLAFFLSPVRTWAVGIALLLVYRAWKGPAPCLRDNSKTTTAS